jgi:hypothetical protein
MKLIAVPIFLGALLAIGVPASADELTASPTLAATTAPPIATTAPASAASASSASMAKRARQAGMRVETKKGTTLYCWEDATVGTRFKTKKCVGEEQLAIILERRVNQRDELNRMAGTCNGGICGSIR